MQIAPTYRALRVDDHLQLSGSMGGDSAFAVSERFVWPIDGVMAIPREQGARTIMSSAFPLRWPVTIKDRDSRVIAIDDDAADAVFAALSSETSRTILAAVHEEPATAAELAEETDTSVQNVRYHLDRLRDAELITVVDTWYSERGREMDVYGASDSELVVFAGDDPAGSLRSRLRSALGVIGLLGLISILLGQLVRITTRPESQEPVFTGGADTGASATEAGKTIGEPIIQFLGVAVPPPVLFFIGGLVVIAIIAVIRYYGVMLRS